MKKTTFSLLVIVLILLSITGCSSNKTEKNSDSLKFKEEYEAINGETNSSGKKHRTISILKDNPFIYVTGEEIVEKIENKETFYVYFGSPYCPWCRSVIEKAIEVAKKKNIDTIYYVDIWDGDHVEILRDTYQLNNDGEPEVVFEGSKDYKELLKYFDNILRDYTLTDATGNEVSVGEKRIFAPNFMYVEKGKAIRLTSGESEKKKDSREELSNEILEDEEKLFVEFFDNQNNFCNYDTDC